MGVYVLDDPKDPALHIDRPDLAVDLLDVGDVVSYDGLPRYHGSRGFPAHSRERTGQVGLPAIVSRHPDDEHVLGQPPFLQALGDAESHRELLEAHGIAAVLCVRAVDGILFEVDVDAPLVDVGTHAVLEPPGRVEEAEVLNARPRILELLVSGPVKEEFKNSGAGVEHFRFLHSAGRLENGVCADIDKRRVYIDLEENTVYSANTQYGGNTMGLKKLAMRLGISKGLKEGWLTEHMFIVGVPGNNGRKTYLTGAFPSMCGKTSTAMIPGQTIIGDDIAYIKKINGKVRAVNVECGIFGIIQDVNPHDDPAKIGRAHV